MAPWNGPKDYSLRELTLLTAADRRALLCIRDTHCIMDYYCYHDCKQCAYCVCPAGAMVLRRWLATREVASLTPWPFHC